MKQINSSAHTVTKKHAGDAHRLSRLEFIKSIAVVSGSLGLWLSGCTLGAAQGLENEGPLNVVDEWIRALNAADVAGFEKLHTETVFATSNIREEPYSGREHVWEMYRTSTGSQIEKITAFSQGQSICLLVNATKFSRSLCYVFNFVDGKIDRVYEYSSGQYDLASSPQFSGIEVSTDDTGLQERLDAMNHMFVEGLNNRDFSVPDLTDSAIFFVPTSPEPLIGRDKIANDGEDYVRFFPDVIHREIQTFGQGNLICTHVVVEGAGVGSLCFVGEFQDGKIAELYEFWSDARVEG